MFERLLWLLLSVAGLATVVHTVHYTVVHELSDNRLALAGVIEVLGVIAFLSGYLGAFMKRGN